MVNWWLEIPFAMKGLNPTLQIRSIPTIKKSDDGQILEFVSIPPYRLGPFPLTAAVKRCVERGFVSIPPYRLGLFPRAILFRLISQ